MIKRFIKDFNVVDVCILILTVMLVIHGLTKTRNDYNVKIKEIERQIAFANAYAAEDLSKEQIEAIMDIAKNRAVGVRPRSEYAKNLQGSVLMVPDTISIATIRDVKNIHPTLPIIAVDSDKISHFIEVYEKEHDIPVGIIYKEDGKVVTTITDKIN